jgi:hypothetical protein
MMENNDSKRTQGCKWLDSFLEKESFVFKIQYLKLKEKVRFK